MSEPIHDESCGCKDCDPWHFRLRVRTISDATTQTYPCEKCGKPRTKAEGGTTFTVCDACWGLAADDIMHQQKAEIQALKGVYADNVQLKAEIEALKAERDEWRDKAGLHQLASTSHKARAGRMEAELAEMREWAGVRYRVNTMCAHNHEMVLYVSDDWAHKCPACSLRAELARLEGLISAITCDEAGPAECQAYCAHGYGPLHAEARAISGRRK